MNCCQQLIARAGTCARVQYMRWNVIQCPDILTAKVFFVLRLEVKNKLEKPLERYTVNEHPDTADSGG